MRKKTLSVYVHIPFCEKKCSYCSFVSFDCCTPSEIEEYVKALCEEIECRGIKYADRAVRTVYLGGGTPSILPPEKIVRIFGALRKAFRIQANAEITVECNPNSVTAEKLECWRGLGVNRISLGVQSTHRATLKTLGRIHTRKQVYAALENITKAGFDNVNVDIIMGVPLPARECAGAEYRYFSEDLENLLFKTVASGADWKRVEQRYSCIKHISVYTLTVEEGTRIESAIRFIQLDEPDEQDWLQEMSDLKYVLNASPFRQYEVSNYAIPGFACRHNQAYWNPGKEYLGLGLAAHSLMDNTRFANTEDLKDYIQNPWKEHEGAQRSSEEVINEIIMLSLRTSRGIRFADLAKQGYDLRVEKEEQIKLLKSLGLISVSETHIRATKKGLNLLNQIIEKLAK